MTLEQFKLKQYRVLVRELKEHMRVMQSYRASANDITIGALDALEDKYETELKHLQMRVRMYTPRKDDEPEWRLTSNEIAQAKLVPISTFLKVPAHKKVLCLFHSDKQPSMHVYGTTYHCFTCSAHGTVVDIIMKTRNCSFASAVRFLIGK